MFHNLEEQASKMCITIAADGDSQANSVVVIRYYLRREIDRASKLMMTTLELCMVPFAITWPDRPRGTNGGSHFKQKWVSNP